MRKVLYKALLALPLRAASAVFGVVGFFGSVWPDRVREVIGAGDLPIQQIGIAMLAAAAVYFLLLWILKSDGGDWSGTHTSGTHTSGTHTTHGPGSHIFAGPVNNPTFSGPPKFSAETVLSALPPFMGGNMTLDLGGVATMRMRTPWDENSVSMELDVVPVKYGDHKGEGIEIHDVTISTGKHQRFLFDRDTNKRHTVSAGGKVFTVTLREIDASPVEGVAKAQKYKFSVVEV